MAGTDFSFSCTPFYFNFPNPTTASSGAPFGSGAATTSSPLATYVFGSSSTAAAFVAPYPFAPFGSSSSPGITPTPVIFGSSSATASTSTAAPAPSLFGSNVKLPAIAASSASQIQSSARLFSFGVVSCGKDSADIEKGLGNEAAQKQLTNEVVNFENRNGVFVPLEIPLASYLKYLSLEKVIIIKKMFEKYGDITKGSIVKSIEVKAAFLHLVVEVVERLGSYSLDSVDARELELIQKWTIDVAAVGFRVEWLEQRIVKFKYQGKLMQLNKMSEKVNGARKALLEMERQEMILKKELDLMKSEMDGKDLCSSNLCEEII